MHYVVYITNLSHKFHLNFKYPLGLCATCKGLETRHCVSPLDKEQVHETNCKPSTGVREQGFRLWRCHIHYNHLSLNEVGEPHSVHGVGMRLKPTQLNCKSQHCNQFSHVTIRYLQLKDNQDFNTPCTSSVNKYNYYRDNY